MNLLKDISINWKTTLTAIVTFIVIQVLPLFGVILSDELKQSIIVIAIAIIGLIAKDSDKSGKLGT